MPLIHLAIATGAFLTPIENWAIDEVQTFPTFDAKGSPAVLVTWRRDLFFRGNKSVQWAIYRNDTGDDVPIGVVDGKQSSFLDTTAPRKFEYLSNVGHITDSGCDLPTRVRADQPGVIVGRPHTYSVASVYKIDVRDLPDEYFKKLPTWPQTCLYRTDAFPAPGYATALLRPSPLTPLAGSSVRDFCRFEFTSAATRGAPVRVAYFLQLSQSPQFSTSKVLTYAHKIGLGPARQSVSLEPRFPGDTFLRFLREMIDYRRFGQGKAVYWRIGVRSIDDDPGPVPDPATGLRAVFSRVSSFVGP